MKIAYFLDTSSGLGGAGNVLLEQARIMSKIHDVIVVIPCSETNIINSEYKERCQKAKLIYKGIYYNTAYFPQYIDIMTAWKSLLQIRKFIIQENIEFLHSVQLNIAVELISRELKIPHLMNAYSLRKEEFILKNIDIFPKYHSCDSILYCKLWSSELQIESRCIRPVAPLSYIRKKNKNKQSLKILMLGDVCQYKNQLTAIQAVEFCNQNGINVFLTIVGNDNSDYAQKCKVYVKKKKLVNLVNIIGFKNNVESFLVEHDCLLCSSTRESFPCSIIEAMTYDLTIISTPVAGVPELLINEKNAYISKGFALQDIINSISECAEAYKNGSILKIQQYAEKTWANNFKEDIVRAKLNNYYSHIRKKYSLIKFHIQQNQLFFKEIISINKRLKQNHINDNVVIQRCFYYAFLKRKQLKGTAYIWGAGNFGKIAKQLIETLFNNISLLSYIDLNKTGKYLGLPIISPKEIKENVDYIFLGFAGEKEHIIEFLEQKGFKYNHNLWILP